MLNLPIITPLIEFETTRLRLRQWRSTDREPFATLCADNKVMAHFPSPLTRAQSDAMAERCAALMDERGWGVWVTELKESGAFMGCVGLHTPSSELPFSPCVEILWRLFPSYWGQGFAAEAARGALHIAFKELNLDEIVAFTTLNNDKSRALMERLNMLPAGTFLHPHLPEESPLRLHSLYRLPQSRYFATI